MSGFVFNSYPVLWINSKTYEDRKKMNQRRFLPQRSLSFFLLLAFIKRHPEASGRKALY